MDPLATEEDVVAQLGRALTTADEDRLPGILAKASALFRLAARQDFTEGESAVRLKVEAGRVRLEQTPVSEVTEVLDDAGVEVGSDLAGQWLTVTRDGTALLSHEFVTVTYSYGGDIPDLVRLTVAEIAAKVLRITPSASAGVITQQRSAGGFQETNTYAPWAVGNMTKLSPEDYEVAESFRYRGTKAIVCQP